MLQNLGALTSLLHDETQKKCGKWNKAEKPIPNPIGKPDWVGLRWKCGDRIVPQYTKLYSERMRGGCESSVVCGIGSMRSVGRFEIVCISIRGWHKDEEEVCYI